MRGEPSLDGWEACGLPFSRDPLLDLTQLGVVRVSVGGGYVLGVETPPLLVKIVNRLIFTEPVDLAFVRVYEVLVQTPQRLRELSPLRRAFGVSSGGLRRALLRSLVRRVHRSLLSTSINFVSDFGG